MKRLLFLVPVIVIAGCSDSHKLAEDQASYARVVAVQNAELDRRLEDATVRGMVLNGAFSEHSAVVFEECRESESKTTTCIKLQDRVTAWSKKHAGDYDKHLRAEGVKP